MNQNIAKLYLCLDSLDCLVERRYRKKGMGVFKIYRSEMLLYFYFGFIEVCVPTLC